MKLPLILALLATLALAACQTPQERFNVDSGVWAIAEVAAPAAEAAAKLTPAQIAIVNANLAAGDKNLADAQAWLYANPALANVPGNGPPSLSTFNVVLSALRSSLIPVATPGVTVVAPSATAATGK